MGLTSPPSDTFSIGEADWSVTGEFNIEGVPVDLTDIDHFEWLDQTVTIEGLVESQEILDEKHLEVRIVSGGQRIFVWLMLPPDEPIPLWENQIIRVTGIYAPKFQVGGVVSQFELFCSGIEYMKLVAPMGRYALFDRPVVDSSTLQTPDQNGETIRITGVYTPLTSEQGFWVQDEAGPIEVITGQTHLPESGQKIEVVGRVLKEGISLRLENALWRPLRESSTDEANRPVEPFPRMLHRMTRTVMELSLTEAEEEHQVQISGVITWSKPDGERLFLQDSSGGVGLEWSTELGEVPAPGRHISILGIARGGGYAPLVQVRAWEDESRQVLPRAPIIGYEQASQGLAEAQWVRMTGFVYAAQLDGADARLNLSTATGKIVAIISSLGGVVRFCGLGGDSEWGLRGSDG